MTSLTEFLLARIAEDEAWASMDIRRDHERAAVEAWSMGASSLIVTNGPGSPRRVLAECEAKRWVVELHRDWPVLVTTPPKLETSDGFDPTTMTMRMAQQIEWQTQEEYRAKFGDEPPTAPMVRAMALVYADHPDFRDEWR